MKSIYIAVAVFAAQAFTQCAYANDKIVTRADYGAEWPFTVDKGILRCSDNEVTFSTGGTEYAVNGSAKSAGYSPMDSIWQPNIELIQEMADATKITLEEAMGEFTLKISVGPMIKSGLELC